MHFELSRDELARFDRLKSLGDLEVIPVRVEEAFFWNWPRYRWGLAANLRLVLPSLLPEVGKILYIDSDVLVLDDVAELWNFPLNGATCAAVAAKADPRHQKRLGLSESAPYFNSGVMLFDLHKMAEERLEEQFVELFVRYSDVIKYPDQDLLNIVYVDTYRKLPLRWNVLTSVYRKLPDTTLYPVEEIREALRHPGIVHFTGSHKPWEFWKTVHHPYANCFLHYAKLAGLNPAFIGKLQLKKIFNSRLKPPVEKVPWDQSILS